MPAILDTSEAAAQVGRFVDCLFEADDIVEIRTLPNARSIWHRADELAGEVDRLRKQNEKRQNVYIGINPRSKRGGRKSADVLLARCLFADWDGIDADEARERWNAAKLPEPTLIVNSGHGCHCYWRLAEPILDLDRWTELQKALIKAVDSDPTICDPPRVMRLPGFDNVKSDPVPCCIVASDPSLRYPLATIEALLPATMEHVAETEDEFNTHNRQRQAKNVAAAAEYLTDLGVEFEQRSTDSQGRVFFNLAICPLKGQRDGNAAVCVDRDGNVWAKCHHAKCTGKTWQDFQSAFGKPFQAAIEAGLADPAGRTDAANARRLVERHGDKIRSCEATKCWLVWDGKRWRIDDTRQIDALAKEYAQSLWPLTRQFVGKVDEKIVAKIISFATQSNSRKGVENMLALARSEPQIAITPAQLDSDPWIMTVENGTLDLKTGMLRQHRKSDFSTKMAPVEFHADAKCPQWENFVSWMLGGNEALIAFLQRWLGYCLTGSVNEQKLLLALGSGSNGKSTTIETYLYITGDYSTKCPPNLLMQRNGDSHPTERASLAGKRAAFVSETPANGRLNKTLVKELTGGDTQTARRLYENFSSFNPVHKICIVTNHKPTIDGDEPAVWRRIILLPFDVVIPESDKDRDLVEKLKAEASGILRWCVEGCLEWQRIGLSPPKEAIDATLAYEQSENTFSTFIDECCTLGSGMVAGSTPLLDAYQQHSGERLTAKQLAALLRVRGFKSSRITSGTSKGRIQWHGLALCGSEQ